MKKGETSAFREPQVLLKRPLTGNGNLRRVKSRRCTVVVREEIREKEDDGSTGRSTRSWGRRRGRGGVGIGMKKSYRRNFKRAKSKIYKTLVLSIKSSTLFFQFKSNIRWLNGEFFQNLYIKLSFSLIPLRFSYFFFFCRSVNDSDDTRLDHYYILITPKI